ncbi:alpha/beta hydrolase [Streptomyces sp. SID3343]|uniref:alpha/beta hydrolase n=1 Tax=Streptomyces sp. SID3343 TaxID=2690260 RepID=UPI00136E2988|nr:alpha/beta hydrolase [Streptomyces sp. SID3343]MYW00026.1 alpha/beta hydrolase fold domain-containing protein [Streptomyces sp. SID3343]
MIDEALDIAYNARDTVGPKRFAELMARYRAESDAAIDGLPGAPGIEYDADSAERLDVWGPGTADLPRPVFVFVHGGYWRALSRADSAFMARMLHEQGVATVVPDYTLAPAATLEEITRQVRAAIEWVYRNADTYGLDRNRIVVGGSSAGGHLAAMTLVGGWQQASGLPDNVAAAGLAISGLYDVRPLVHTQANTWLDLDDARATALSPLVCAVAEPVPTALVVAEHEASGFHEQAELMRAAWDTDLLTIPGRNHFDVILDLADAESVLSRTLLNLIRGL